MSAQDRKRRRYDEDVDQRRLYDDDKRNERYLTDEQRRRNKRDMTLTAPRYVSAEAATSRFLSFIGDDEDVAPQYIETHRQRYTRALPTPKAVTHSSSDDTTAPSSAPRTWRKLSVVTKNQQTIGDVALHKPHHATQSTSASVSALDRAKQIAMERERDVEQTVSSADGGDGGVDSSNGHGDAAVSDLERLRQSLLQKRLSAKRAAILSPTANTANAMAKTLTESKHADSVMDTG